jgi:Holliday junction resolvase RusA-like endonuclease
LKLKEVIYGTIVSKSNNYRSVKGRFITTDKVKAYESDFLKQCTVYRNANISDPFWLLVDVYYPSNRSDLDGAFKILLDLLQKVKAISNDNQCHQITARKMIDKINPRIEFSLIKL